MDSRLELEEIKKVAQLAKLSFKEEELQAFFEDINNIVSHFAKLEELNLENVSPTSHISWSNPPTNPDQPAEWPEHQKILKNAPQVSGNYIIVPKIVDK
ncbi:MAG: Asp-tRNA(Asn)/Glu-tRNA(Gln) amidotransferase subunit GatC [Candidatus Atribacteria bacterium]|nr:Asp-tRNA(Asn)/Glu-tRNA(Gln) amidotransferase subunit GatC [Candidatus Atribacteria bacterium]MCD6349954.1 Asp-tRNA(Asn)/Glu-tRNA(Gln) amidotransferase subunit GatC [Candidatus Atribacteria bacterium]